MICWNYFFKPQRYLFLFERNLLKVKRYEQNKGIFTELQPVTFSQELSQIIVKYIDFVTILIGS
jgi:hypothetical protein